MRILTTHMLMRFYLTEMSIYFTVNVNLVSKSQIFDFLLLFHQIHRFMFHFFSSHSNHKECEIGLKMFMKC
jgi:hypothetical protein